MDWGLLKLVNYSSAFAHLLVCFCPLAFLMDIGLNMLSSDVYVKFVLSIRISYRGVSDLTSVAFTVFGAVN